MESVDLTFFGLFQITWNLGQVGIWCQVLPHTGKPYKMELSRAKQVLGTSGKGLLVARNIPSFGTEEIKKIDLLLQQNYFTMM